MRLELKNEQERGDETKQKGGGIENCLTKKCL